MMKIEDVIYHAIRVYKPKTRGEFLATIEQIKKNAQGESAPEKYTKKEMDEILFRMASLYVAQKEGWNFI